MKFGQLENVDDIDFHLPENPPENAWILGAHKSETKVAEIHVGLPVFANEDFVGRLYPEDSSREHFLFHYSRQFNCIELNSTYYGIPARSTVLKWRGQVPAHFKFCPKFPKVLSNRRNFGFY